MLLVVPSVSASGLVNANVTLVAPASSATLSQVVVLNASIPENAEGYNRTYFLASSASTANSTAVIIAQATNTTLTAFNTTYNTTGLEDASNYVFQVILTNGTTNITASTTSVVIDNTNPATPSSLSPTATQTSNSVTFSGTVGASTTTACTLNFIGINPGASSYTMTHTGSSCSADLTNVADQTYVYTITASDGSDTTTSSSASVEINAIGSENIDRARISGGLNEQGKKIVQTGSGFSIVDDLGVSSDLITFVLVVGGLALVAFLINKYS